MEIISFKSKVLFLAHTEYHLMLTLSIIHDNYNNGEVDVTLILTNPGIGRLSGNFDFQIFPNIKFLQLRYSEHSVEYNSDLSLMIRGLIKEEFAYFIFFNHHFYLDIVLAKLLRKRGTRICLAPDGLKAYSSIKKITPRWSLMSFLKLRKFVSVNKFPDIGFHIPMVRYASLREIDEIWVQYARKFHFGNRYAVKKIDLLSSKLSIMKISEFFRFQRGDAPIENSIFYINQPFFDPAAIRLEAEVIASIRVRFPMRTFYVKLHPLSPSQQIDHLRTISGLIIIERGVPAELYCLNTSNSTILSMWSTSALIPNSTCRYYWLYPIFRQHGLIPRNIKIENPTEHIHEVVSVDQVN